VLHFFEVIALNLSIEMLLGGVQPSTLKNEAPLLAVLDYSLDFAKAVAVEIQVFIRVVLTADHVCN